MEDAKSFINKLKIFERSRKNQTEKMFVCPIYLSANGFEPEIENWLHEQFVLTSDLETWDKQ